MNKLVDARSRSIDAKKKESQKQATAEAPQKRQSCQSEDKDQVKYVIQEDPLVFNKKPQLSVVINSRFTQSKNKYFLYLRNRINEEQELVQVMTSIQNSFRDHSSVAHESFLFKTQIGFYKIKQKIGKGCFGKVYLAI